MCTGMEWGLEAEGAGDLGVLLDVRWQGPRGSEGEVRWSALESNRVPLAAVGEGARRLRGEDWNIPGKSLCFGSGGSSRCGEKWPSSKSKAGRPRGEKSHPSRALILERKGSPRAPSLHLIGQKWVKVHQSQAKGRDPAIGLHLHS